MKKLLVSLFVITMMFLISTGAMASPQIWEEEFDFSDFNEVRRLAETATDEEWYEFLFGYRYHPAMEKDWRDQFEDEGFQALMRRRSRFRSLRIDSREDALEVVDTIGRMFVPVLPGARGVERTSYLRFRSDSPDFTPEVHFRMPEGYVILFGTHDRHELTTSVFFNSYAFDSPTVVRDGVEYHQFLLPHWEDRYHLVVIVEDYALWVQFRTDVWGDIYRGLSPEEELKQLLRFSFVRFAEDNIETPTPFECALVIVTIVSAIGAVVIIAFAKARRGHGRVGRGVLGL